MTYQETVAYFRSREEQERKMAQIAATPAIAQIHLVMALHYSRQAEALVPIPTPVPRIPVILF